MLGSPIRQSWVPKMYAPRPSLSQLTTTFIGNSSQAIPQIAQVAKFYIKQHLANYTIEIQSNTQEKSLNFLTIKKKKTITNNIRIVSF